ncbi:MAG TPA: hypothetical protein VGF92_05445 [Stellaceae bacterium]|jgi:hypothetical protein
MTTRNRPNYQIYYLPLTNAGQMDVPAIGTRVAMLGCFTGATVIFSGGAQQLAGGTPTAGTVNVQVGKTLGDGIPFAPGNKLRVDNKFDFLRFSWSAQAGVIAIMAVSDDAEGNGIEFDAPPAVALGNFTLQQGGNVAQVDFNGALQVQLRDVFGGLIGEGDPSSGGLRVDNSTRIGASSVSLNGPAAGATTILAAGSNTNGVTVKAGFTVLGGSAVFLQLCSGATPPTSLTSNPSLLTGFSTFGVLPEDIYLPPGQGLYAWEGSAGAGGMFGTYTVH